MSRFTRLAATALAASSLLSLPVVSAGPFIYVSGSMSVSPGIKARFIFRNQRQDGAPHEAIAIADVTLFSNGFAFQFPKQPMQGGVGGNPWISVRFGNPEPTSTETLLGRCVQLLPGN